MSVTVEPLRGRTEPRAADGDSRGTPRDPLFDRDLRLGALPRTRQALVWIVRLLAFGVSLGGAWAAARLVYAAPAWAGFGSAAVVAAAWCEWLELRGPGG